MKRCLLLLSLIVLAGWGSAATADERPPEQWIVVTAPAFHDAVEPLAAQRRTEGMRVAVVQTTDVLRPDEIIRAEAGRLRDHVHRLCRDFTGTSYVLLVGAVEAGQLDDATRKVVPALPGMVGRMKGEPSDNGYGCPGGGLTPSVAVGRWPVRTADEARGLVRKTLAFERDFPPGAWKRRVTLLVGHPVAGPASAAERFLAELFVENACLSRAEKLHPAWTARAVFDLPRSRFAVPAEKLHEVSLNYLKDGQMFTVYAGHSAASGRWSEAGRFLERDDWARLRGPGVFVSCGCWGCQLRGPDGEGYGLAALRNPAGPVGVVGADGESYAALGQLAFDGLVGCLAEANVPERLGAVWLRVKAGIASGKIDKAVFDQLDQADGSRGKVPLEVQRPEHLEMWLLLGDPALRLPALPLDVMLKADGEPVAGQALTVHGELPQRLAGARVRVALERPLTGQPADMQPLPTKPAERTQVMMANHERANRVELAAQEVRADGSSFEVRLEVPKRVPWPRLVVRAHAATDRAEGLGVLTLGKPRNP